MRYVIQLVREEPASTEERLLHELLAVLETRRTTAPALRGVAGSPCHAAKCHQALERLLTLQAVDGMFMAERRRGRCSFNVPTADGMPAHCGKRDSYTVVPPAGTPERHVCGTHRRKLLAQGWR